MPEPRRHRTCPSRHATECPQWDWLGEPGVAEEGFAVVAVTDEVLELAARSAARHPLRALDAVQLASALAAREADPDLTTFVCFDEALADAARAEGFAALQQPGAP